jgi:FkbM family methyltransferase
MLGKKRKDIILKSRILGKVFLSRENETRDLVFFIAQQLHSYGFLKFLPHEKNVQKTLRILNGDLFIDVGANLGFYCFILNRNFKKIIAIEPHPGNVEEIIKSMKAFGIKNIECVQKAVSNLNGPLPLFISKGDSGHALGAWTKNGERIVVETVTMQTLLKNIRKVDLVKVDVEGAEWQVLDGSLQVIEKIKSWVIELHNLKRKTELENLLYSLNYSVKWLDYNHVFAWRRYR